MTIDQVTCSIPDCSNGPGGKPWQTPVGITTYAAQAAVISNHLQMDHFSDFHPEKKTTKIEKGEKSKVETKIERPKLAAQVTDAQWTVWFSKWSRFIEASGLEGLDAINQLWEAMDETTEVDLIHKGVDKLRDIKKVMEKLKAHVCKR